MYFAKGLSALRLRFAKGGSKQKPLAADTTKGSFIFIRALLFGKSLFEVSSCPFFDFSFYFAW